MKAITSSGKRKQATARASLTSGTGLVRINGVSLENYNPKISRLKIMEPIILAGKVSGSVNLSIKVEGGGVNSQAEAARLALSRALVEFDNSVEGALLDYDRRLLVADVRRKETRKPNRHGKARAKRQKSYR